MADVRCNNPGIITNADRIDLDGPGNFSLWAKVRYKCLPGYQIAKEQDAVGVWITDQSVSNNLDKNSADLLCMLNGKWKPLPIEIHCSGEYKYYYSLLGILFHYSSSFRWFLLLPYIFINKTFLIEYKIIMLWISK